MRAVGGNITYTDLDGLNPSLTPYENGYVIHTFLSSEDLIVSEGGDVEYLIVAGGGAGGAFGGGGGGGVRTGSINIESGTFPVVVGDGGIPAFSDNALASVGNGEDSSFSGIVSVGGGGGGNSDVGEVYAIGADGGSGGGGGANFWKDGKINYGGSGITGQGNDGGNTLGEYGSPCGGGGGAGEAGYDSNTRKGGDGIESLISGESKYYGGGGGGGAYDVSVGVYGDGGLGGGGRGSWVIEPGGCTSTSGEANTGGGGGGGYGVYVYDPGDPKPGTYGGSGIVILKYLYSPTIGITTLPASNITQSNFVANGSIDSIGEGITVVKRGFCYKVK